MKAIVIGSGMSGLTAATTLVQEGADVTLFEQYEQIGGVTASFEKDGYHWDLGQLIIEALSPNEPVGSVLASLGVLNKIHTRLEDRGYVFKDFELKKPETYQGLLWRINRLKEIFPQDAGGLDRYWRDYLRVMRVLSIGRKMENSQGLELMWLKARLYTTLLPILSKVKWNAQQLMDDYFTTNELKLVFVSILADFATPTADFLGLGVFALNPETVYDKRIPASLGGDSTMLYHYSVLGGVGRLAEALAERFIELGGKVLTNRAVEKIIIENGHVSGVIDVKGERWQADVVVASGGARELFRDLVGVENLPEGYIDEVNQIPLMCSVYMLHLGLDFDPTPYLHGVATYYYGTYDLDGTLNELKNGIYHEGKAGFVIHVPTVHSPDMAPKGCHSMTVYTVCPDKLANGTWGELKEIYAEKLIGYTEKYIPGLREHIQVKVIMTPEEFRARLHIDQHAFGGLAPVMNAWRISHQTPVDGLWFIGAQSESGGGVNTVIRTSYKVAKQILIKQNQ